MKDLSEIILIFVSVIMVLSIVNFIGHRPKAKKEKEITSSEHIFYTDKGEVFFCKYFDGNVKLVNIDGLAFMDLESKKPKTPGFHIQFQEEKDGHLVVHYVPNYQLKTQ